MRLPLATVVVVVCLQPSARAAAQDQTPPLLETTTTTERTATTTVTPPSTTTAPPSPSPQPPQPTLTARERDRERERSGQDDEWAKDARFFAGVRGAVGFPPGGDGLAPLGGIEVGVAARKGAGFGLHVFGTANTPGAPLLELPSTPYGFGATADFRYYLQSIEPLRLYPMMSVGFLAGPDEVTGKNAVLPLLTPGFGARMNLADVYVSVELGAASFYIPFMAISVGWEPRHRLE